MWIVSCGIAFAVFQENSSAYFKKNIVHDQRHLNFDHRRSEFCQDARVLATRILHQRHPAVVDHERASAFAGISGRRTATKMMFMRTALARSDGFVYEYAQRLRPAWRRWG